MLETSTPGLRWRGLEPSLILAEAEIERPSSEMDTISRVCLPKALRQPSTLPTCYHPLLLFNREGDCLAVKLRPGNVHSAEDWERVLLPEVKRQQKQGKDVVVRADAAFAKPELYEALEKRGVKYAIRIPSNDTLGTGPSRSW